MIQALKVVTVKRSDSGARTETCDEATGSRSGRRPAQRSSTAHSTPPAVHSPRNPFSLFSAGACVDKPPLNIYCLPLDVFPRKRPIFALFVTTTDRMAHSPNPTGTKGGRRTERSEIVLRLAGSGCAAVLDLYKSITTEQIFWMLCLLLGFYHNQWLPLNNAVLSPWQWQIRLKGVVDSQENDCILLGHFRSVPNLTLKMA